MTEKFSELIVEFERAESRISEAISATPEASSEVMSELDTQLVNAFAQLLKADLCDGGELIDRIRYLTERLTQGSAEESVTGQIGAQIIKDAYALMILNGSDSPK